MQIAKRIVLFVMVNILIMVTLSTVMSVLGVRPYLDASGINYESLMAFCLIWGFGGAFISLALSRVMAKWMMGVKIVDPRSSNPQLQFLVERVHALSRQAGIETMPEVGIFESPDVNAFATGPTKNRSLVAVSTGLLQHMNEREADGVLAHEVAHIANGDMVTMTLVQGIVNAFVMFLARVIAYFASQFVEEEKRHWVNFGVMIGLEILLGMLGMIVVASFSRHREFRADEGGARLSGTENMIAALESLKARYGRVENAAEAQPALASLQISGKSGGFFALFSTHPSLEDRIERLRSLRV